jgi:ubiquinol-cytochrome c reductase cytochrome b subunit
LFQLLKYLPGSLELVGTVILPGIAGLLLFLLPFFDKGESRKMAGRMKFIAPILVGGVGIVLLTIQAKRDDAQDQHFQATSVDAQKRADRAIALAKTGIPPGGPIVMLRNDPQTRGADLYAQHCSTCHVMNGKGEYEAPVHTGLHSREWILGLLHDPQDARYFGRTEIDEMKSMTKLGDQKLKEVTEFLFAEGHEQSDPPFDAALATAGAEVFKEKCMDCHIYKGEGAETFDGPDMTGYGSRAWLEKQISTPESIYGELNKMTAFADELSPHDISMVAIYLRGERFRRPETGPLPKLAQKQ